MIHRRLRWPRRLSTPSEPRGLLGRLARDARGNVLAMMTAGLIPLIGMVGGGLDLGRMYIVKTRLQHACDAGALAGRRAMGSGTWAANNYSARTTANQFFDGNVDAAPYGANTVTRTFVENSGRVVGTSSAKLPMALMQIFGVQEQTLTVQCDAELQLPNADVMFVLDVSGSMGSKIPGDTVDKIVSLRRSVKCFYEAVARIDTTEVCATTPSGTLDPGIQIRFGFAPYSTNVNIAAVLPNDYFVSTAKYQTRRFAYSTGRSTFWNYDQFDTDVSAVTRATGAFPRTMNAAVGSGGSNVALRWDGCTEDADTVPGTNFIPVPTGAYDLNIDLVPTQSDPHTLLKPVLKGISFPRADYSGQLTLSPVTSTGSGFPSAYYDCPPPARKMQVWPTASPFEAYVDTLVPTSTTYHDIGMLWGARLLSPDGMFASENVTTPSGQPIARHLIFMTDGAMNARYYDHAAYGLPWFDRRNVASPGDYFNDDFNAEANARLVALCEMVKDKNITLWVVSFGNGFGGADKARLERCASPGHFYHASNSTALEQVFSTIAGKISELRITQ